MLKRFGAIVLICLTLLSSFAIAVPLQLYTDYVTQYPSQSRKGQWIQLMARGSGTNDMYVMEVDPATGALPVSGSIVVTNPSVGPTGDPVPLEANYIAGINPSGDLQGLSVDANGVLNVNADFSISNDTNYGVVGANTLRTAAQIGNATGAADFNAGSASAQTLRVVVANDQTAIPASQSGTWNINNITGTVSLPTGAATETTLGTRASETTVAAISGKLPATLGQKTMANSLAVAIASDQSAIPVSTSNLPTTADTNYGTPGASTLRTASMLGVGSTAVSNSNPVPISDAGSSITVDGTVSASNFPATVDTNFGSTSANTIRVAAVIGNTLGGFNYGYGAVGASTLRVASQIGNTTGAADFNAGTAGAQTLRVVTASNSPGSAGRAYSDSSVLDYSSSNVGTGAWVQVDSSTAAVFNLINIFSSCANTLELGTGAAASETRVLLIPPGGLDSPTPLAIAAGTRLSVRSIAGTCTTGSLVLTGLN